MLQALDLLVQEAVGVRRVDGPERLGGLGRAGALGVSPDPVGERGGEVQVFGQEQVGDLRGRPVVVGQASSAGIIQFSF